MRCKSLPWMPAEMWNMIEDWVFSKPYRPPSAPPFMYSPPSGLGTRIIRRGPVFNFVRYEKIAWYEEGTKQWHKEQVFYNIKIKFLSSIPVRRNQQRYPFRSTVVRSADPPLGNFGAMPLTTPWMTDRIVYEFVIVPGRETATDVWGQALEWDFVPSQGAIEGLRHRPVNQRLELIASAIVSVIQEKQKRLVDVWMELHAAGSWFYK